MTGCVSEPSTVSPLVLEDGCVPLGSSSGWPLWGGRQRYGGNPCLSHVERNPSVLGRPGLHAQIRSSNYSARPVRVPFQGVL